jgi:hypothetical protein
MTTGEATMSEPLNQSNQIDALWDYDHPAESEAALGRDDAARPYFARDDDTLSRDPWLAESEPARLERLRTPGYTGRH